MSKKESYRRTIYPNSRIIYHGRTRKEKKHEELTRKCRTDKGSSGEKQTLEQNLNKEKIQKKRKRRETSGQNRHGKTETCLHNKRILATHVSFNCSDIKTVINA